MKYAIIAIIVIAALIIGAGIFMSSFITGGRRQTREEARAWQNERIDTGWYDLVGKSTYTVPGFEGYELRCQLLINPKATDDYVIISHGYTDNMMGDLKYADLYMDLGFNVLIYDLRGHGENEPSICTYTVRERKDLRELIKDTRKRYPNIRRLGIHGESLGAATSIAVLNYQPEIDFVVSDCAFSDLKRVLQDGMGSSHIPGFVLDLGAAFMKLRFKLDMDDMRPIDCIKGNRIPVLFIHGKNDQLIPPFHSELMIQETAGLRDLRLVEGAGHAESVFADRTAYEGYIKEFLDKVYAIDGAGAEAYDRQGE